MFKNKPYHIINYCISIVWITNGLFCKVLNMVPRHEEIVGRILGNDFSKSLTVLIGLSEIGMAIWILSGIKKRLNVITQISVVVTMNIFEFFLVPDLLLWGKLNSLFAFLFVLIIYINEFHLVKQN